MHRLAQYANSRPLILCVCSCRAYHILGAFAIWAPRLHGEYRENLARLYDKDPTLLPNYFTNVFTSATVNFGPQVVTFPHVDELNVPFGWCAITALGKFNHRVGGHLVLWDLNMVVEFPSGSTILIPSATIRHSNVAIQPKETRHSFTQYTSGSLFRWVACGHRTEKAFKLTDPSAWAEFAEKRASSANRAVNLFSTIGELQHLARENASGPSHRYHLSTSN